MSKAFWQSLRGVYPSTESPDEDHVVLSSHLSCIELEHRYPRINLGVTQLVSPELVITRAERTAHLLPNWPELLTRETGEPKGRTHPPTPG